MTIRKPILLSVIALIGAGSSSAALAQTSGLTIPIPQSVVSVLVGNGIQQSVPIVSVPTTTQPLIGVGALSGGPDHIGTLLSISLLNSGRLLGVDGPGGLTSALSISLPNPKGAPVLSPAK